MTNAELRDRIKARLEELDRSPITAALKGGLERTYLRDFLIEKKKSINADSYPPIAVGLDWSVEELLGGRAAQPQRSDVTAAPEFDEPQTRLGAQTLEVLGTTLGGRDDDRGPDFWMNGETVNYIARPRKLRDHKSAFGLYVGGDSMYPRHRARDLVIVEKASPAPGDDVVIELKPTEGDGEPENPSFIKEFVARRGSYITVKQLNPEKEIDFDLREIKTLYRVIPLKELLG